MKVLLVYPNIIESPKEISMGLAHISAMLKQDKHEIGLIDTTFGNRSDSDIMKQVDKFKPELVLITVASNDFKFGMHIADLIKAKYNIPIMAGGYHATMDPDETLNHKSIDFVGVGEGDLAIQELVNMLAKKQDRTDIRNIWFKKDGKIIPNPQRNLPNLDELPIPDRSIFDLQKYIDWHGGVLTVISTRGCPFPCTYCINRKHKEIYKGAGKFVRYKSVDMILEEIKGIKEKFKIKEVLFNDDTFTLDKDRVKEFCEKYPKVMGHLPFSINGRVNTVERDTLMMLGKAGCSRINMGVECGNLKIRNEILERMMTDQQIIDTFNWAKEAGIETYAFNMIGLPYETKEMIQETIDLNIKINPTFVGVTIFTALPGTPLFALCKKEGWLKEDYGMSYFQDTNVNHPNFTLKELKKIRDSFGFQVYRKTKPFRAYVDLVDKSLTKYKSYMWLRGKLIAYGAKKLLNKIDSENFFEVKVKATAS